MRTLVATFAFALVVAACGGASTTNDSASRPTEAAVETTETSAPPTEATATTADDEAPPATPTTAVSDSEGAATTAPPATEPPIDGPAAPPFELALHSGETFSLEEEQKPIYMVFWAEW